MFFFLDDLYGGVAVVRGQDVDWWGIKSVDSLLFSLLGFPSFHEQEGFGSSEKVLFESFSSQSDRATCAITWPYSFLP